MKLLIILAVTALCNAAKLDRIYLPPNAQTSGGSDSILQTPLSQQPLQNQQASNIQLNNFSRNDQNEASGFGPANQNNVYSSGINGIQAQYQNGFNNLGSFDAKPERAQAAFERNAAILRQSNENDGERYSYAYETENGIYAEENGVATNGVEAEGGFSYTGDDGKVYSIRYTADQNGFVPQGEHLPTPPPVPEEILKALEQNARDEAAGIYDDGSYNEAKYANEETQGYDFNANNQYSNANNQVNTDAIIVNSAVTSGPSNTFITPVTNNVAPAFGRTNNFGNNAPAFNAAASFRKPSQTYESNVGPSFGNNGISSGNNGPSFGSTAPSSVANTPSFNAPAVATPTFGRASPVSPVYGPPTANGASSADFSRTAATLDNSSTFGQRTFGVPATTGSARADLEKSYLPPFQRSNSQNGFGRSQSFNEKEGYQY